MICATVILYVLSTKKYKFDVNSSTSDYISFIVKNRGVDNIPSMDTLCNFVMLDTWDYEDI